MASTANSLAQPGWFPPSGQRRIAVVGTTGSGKSVLARTLAAEWGIAYVELDALYWQPNWIPAPAPQFQAAVTAALGQDEWVVDGNHSDVRDLIWQRAALLVWLDYPQVLVFGRLLRRTLRRMIVGEVLWNGNREDLRHQPLWRVGRRWLARLRGRQGEDGGEAFAGQQGTAAWSGHQARRLHYPALLRQPAYDHLQLVHLRSPQQADHWLASLRRAG